MAPGLAKKNFFSALVCVRHNEADPGTINTGPALDLKSFCVYLKPLELYCPCFSHVFPQDSLASVLDRTLLVLDSNNDVMDPTKVIKYLKQAADVGGFSTRWAIAATPSTTPPTLQAELQMLPVASKHLTKANLKADNAVSVQLARIPLRVEMFDGTDAAGPIPTLFAADRDSAFHNLMNNLQEVLDGVNNLNQRFLYMENLSLDDAVKYLQGQAKKAKGTPAFKPNSGCPPPAKKNKTAGGPAAPPANTAASSTGTA